QKGTCTYTPNGRVPTPASAEAGSSRPAGRPAIPISVPVRRPIPVLFTPSSVPETRRVAPHTRPLPRHFPKIWWKYRPQFGFAPVTWHNGPHDRTRSATRGATPRRLQARLRILLSALRR